MAPRHFGVFCPISCASFVATLAIAGACHGSAEATSADDPAAFSNGGTSRSLAVGPFNDVEIHSALEVEITRASTTSVRVEGNARELDKLHVEVKGGRLNIGYDGNNRRGKIRIWIAAPQIRELEVSGASEVTWRDVEQESVDVEINGASSIEIKGRVKAMDLEIHGASSLKAAELASETVEAKLHGASSADVWVQRSLDATVSGASTLRYKGEPTKVERKVSGASTISAVR